MEAKEAYRAAYRTLRASVGGRFQPANADDVALAAARSGGNVRALWCAFKSCEPFIGGRFPIGPRWPTERCAQGWPEYRAAARAEGA